MAYPESYYRSPELGAVQEMEWQEKKEQIKRERKAYRKQVGCAGCYYREDEVFDGEYTCSIDMEKHAGGFCKLWFDIRTGKTPDESA